MHLQLAGSELGHIKVIQDSSLTDTPSNILLRHYDILYVPKRRCVHILLPPQVPFSSS